MDARRFRKKEIRYEQLVTNVLVAVTIELFVICGWFYFNPSMITRTLIYRDQFKKNIVPDNFDDVVKTTRIEIITFHLLNIPIWLSPVPFLAYGC